jgi:glycine cleavage system H protein
VTGTVVLANDELADAPQRLNEDPYGEGWICLIEPDDATAYESLLDAAAYRALITD